MLLVTLAQEYFPPSSQPAVHALLDQINSSEAFDKVKKDCLVYYLLLWAFPVERFPAPALPPTSTAAPTEARRREDDRASRFARAEVLPPSFTRTTTAYYLLDQGYHIQAIGFLSTSEENQVDFKDDILRVLRGIPDDYTDPAAQREGQEGSQWPWGTYRAHALSAFVDGLSIDTVGVWRAALLDLMSAEDGAASAASPERTALKEAEANLIAYAEAAAFDKGPWLTWDNLVEALPQLIEGMVVEIGVDLNDEGEAAIADQIHDDVISMKEMLARKVWEPCFYREYSCWGSLLRSSADNTNATLSLASPKSSEGDAVASTLGRLFQSALQNRSHTFIVVTASSSSDCS